jgi:hypothetical protein
VSAWRVLLRLPANQQFHSLQFQSAEAHAAQSERLQFLAWFKANCLPGRDSYFSPGSRVSPNAGLARPDIENAKPTQLNSVALGESFFHGFKDRFDSHLSFRLGYACTINDFVNNV